MTNPRTLKIAVWSLAVLLLVTLGWSGYLLFQNYWWKREATRYTEASARLEAHAMFRKGIFCLYKIDGQCDEAHFSGQRDGPFEVWVAFYQPSLGAAHRYVTERWVETFNEQMRLMQREPEKFRKRMGWMERRHTRMRPSSINALQRTWLAHGGVILAFRAALKSLAQWQF